MGWMVGRGARGKVTCDHDGALIDSSHAYQWHRKMFFDGGLQFFKDTELNFQHLVRTKKFGGTKKYGGLHQK